VLFPPGWIHETLNTAQGCTVALTTQFDTPRPARYYRTFYQRLRRVGDLHPCWGQMVRWGSLGVPKKQWPSGPAAARAQASKLFQRRNGTLSSEELDFFDADADGVVTEAEFVETFAGWLETERAVQKERPVQMPAPDMSLDDPSSTSAARPAGKAGGEL